MLNKPLAIPVFSHDIRRTEQSRGMHGIGFHLFPDGIGNVDDRNSDRSCNRVEHFVHTVRADQKRGGTSLLQTARRRYQHVSYMVPIL